MSVNLKHFVDINIKQHVSTGISGTRDTVLLITSDGGSADSDVRDITDITKLNYTTKCVGLTNVLAYLEIYFANGGAKAEVHCLGNVTIANYLLAANIRDEIICIAYAIESQADCLTAMTAAATAQDTNVNVYGINKKLFLAPVATVASQYSSDSLIVKIGALGCEMTIAAYLSQINVYGIDTVYDYMYTKEVMTPYTLASDTVYTSLMLNNINVDVELAGAIRNCGGNTTNGADIVNTFVLIILHQTVTYRLVELLGQKIKNSTGLSKIYATISQELGNYVTSGYLATDKVWTDQDLVITYNNESYTIIENGTALSDGYSVKILPFTSLSDADKAAHKTPPIYIILGTQYGIRAITISGEVI